MEEQDKDNDYVLVFDHFYTNNHIQILKSLIPYLDTNGLPMLPVMIKYMELQYTIQLVQQKAQPASTALTACSKESSDIETIYKAIHKYLAPDEDNNFKQIINLMHTMDNVREMQQMMEMVQSMSNDTDSPGGFPDLSSLEGLMNKDMNLGDIMNLVKNMK